LFRVFVFSWQIVPRRRFGRHPDAVSIIGLGGYHIGKDYSDEVMRNE
jgi:aryl-alcohol dehydrogenase-like predicted oxidoreductase